MLLENIIGQRMAVSHRVTLITPWSRYLYKINLKNSSFYSLVTNKLRKFDNIRLYISVLKLYYYMNMGTGP